MKYVFGNLITSFRMSKGLTLSETDAFYAKFKLAKVLIYRENEGWTMVVGL